MKKKLTILAAAILGTASIVATSAHAAPLAVTVAGVTNATTATAPQTVAVPTSNVIDNTDSVALAATADTGTVITFNASGVKLVPALNSASAPVNAASGTTSYSATSQGSAITLYAFTTSTNVGSVTIVNGSYSTVVYIQGTAGAANNITAWVPGDAGVGTSPSIAVTAKDVFGNPVASEAISVTLVGALFADGTSVKTLTTATKAAATADTTGATVWGQASTTLSPLTGGSVTVVATDISIAASATGLPAAVRAATISFAVTDWKGQVLALTSQVNSLTTQLATANSLLAKSQADLAKSQADLATATAALASEKTAHSADTASSKSALDAATTALTVEKAAHDADNAQALTVANALNAKYNALVKKYNAMAKKYKFATTK